MALDTDPIRRLFEDLSRRAGTVDDLLAIADELSYALMDVAAAGERIAGTLASDGPPRGEAEAMVTAFRDADNRLSGASARIRGVRRVRSEKARRDGEPS